MTMTTMTTTTTLLLFIVLIIISCYSSSIETVAAKETNTKTNTNTNTNTKTTNTNTKTKTETTKTNTKIAIIGGGISGSFITKYLTDYDTNTSSCSLDITIFDPYHTGSISSSIIENEEVKEEEVKESSTTSSQNNQNNQKTQNNQNNQNHNQNHNQQGSRVSSYTLNDGITVVERGASIIFSGNKLVNDMIDSSSSSSSSSNEEDNEEDLNKLIRVKPHGSDAGSGGMTIYNGRRGRHGGRHGGRGHGRRGSSDDDDDENNDSSSFPLLLTNNMTSDEKKSIMIYRYNLDLYKINSATDKTIELFNRIYTDLLNDAENDAVVDADNEDVYEFLNSPNDIWKYIGLFDIANISFQDYLIKNLGVSTSSSLSWWIRKKFGLLLTGVIQGLVHTELYEPMNICNNNQINKQITGIV